MMDEMIQLDELLPDVARKETRDVTFTGLAVIPDDSYGLLEYYCPYPDCDCQMVMIGVVSKKKARVVARFAYNFEEVEGMEDVPNPALSFGPQDDYAEALLAWFAHHLEEDPAYRERLKRHYTLVKEVCGSPQHPAYKRFQDWLASLPPENAQPAPPAPTKRKQAGSGKPPRVPVAMQPRYAEIVRLTDGFCQEKLNQEYAAMCREMTAALARKRSSPLVGGQASIWAAGIVYAVCQVNVGFDKTQEPHTSPDEIAAGFTVRKNTASQKAGAIRKTLNIGMMDTRWTLPSLLGSNTMAWLISVDGLIVDARNMPLEIQYEAYRKGLIPYVPGERE